MFKKLIEDPSYVVFDWFLHSQYYPEYVQCDMIDIPGIDYYLRDFAFPIAKGSQYFELLMYQMKILKERGIFAHLDEMYKARPQTCPGLSGEPLGFGQTFSAFILLLIGISTGLLVMM